MGTKARKMSKAREGDEHRLIGGAWQAVGFGGVDLIRRNLCGGVGFKTMLTQRSDGVSRRGNVAQKRQIYEDDRQEKGVKVHYSVYKPEDGRE